MHHEWEEVSMRVVALMNGTQGEKAHNSYKEGEGSHRSHVDYCYAFGLL